MAKLRVTYNAPVVLTFTLLAVLVYLLPGSFDEPGSLSPGSLKLWFVSYPKLGDPYGARSYVGLISHVLGHANWQHLFGNFTLILLIGPILEERHGSINLLVMILICALVGGLISTFRGDMGIGASGVDFMMILLVSMANIRKGDIPLTFIAVAGIYLSGELYAAFHHNANDHVDHIAHLVGGGVGAAFGFLGARLKGEPKASKPAKSPLDAAAKLDKLKLPG